MKRFWWLILLLGCKWGEPGHLEVDLWWESPSGIYTDCDLAGVDLVRYRIYNRRDELVRSSSGTTGCRDSISFYSDLGGDHELEITGYYFSDVYFDDVQEGWEVTCTNLFVDGDKTPLYECEIPMNRRDL